MLIRIIVALVSLFLAFPGTSLAQDEPRVLRVASWGPPKHFLSLSRMAWIDAVNKRAQGRIKIIEYPSGQLYGPKDIHRAVSRGLVDLGAVLQPRLMSTVPLLQGVYLPFAYDSMEQAAKAYNGESLTIIGDALRDINLQLIYPSFSGGVQLFSHQGNIEDIADLDQLRVLATSPMITAILNELGSSPDTSIPQSEQYMALKRGVSDAMLNSIVGGYFQRNHEVAPYLTLADMSFPTILLAINLDVWNSLPEDIQAIMLEEGEKQAAYSLAASAAMDARFVKEIAKDGGVVKPLPPAVRNQIKQLSQQIWHDWAQQNGSKARRLLQLNLPSENANQE